MARADGEVMLNVRMSSQLKDHGAQVLQNEGIATSDAVRGLFRVLEATQEVPECIRAMVGCGKRDDISRKRAIVKSWRGAAPGVSGSDFDEVRRDRLDAKFAPGVRS